MLSASFRHGMMTETTSGISECAGIPLAVFCRSTMRSIRSSSVYATTLALRARGSKELAYVTLSVHLSKESRAPSDALVQSHGSVIRQLVLFYLDEALRRSCGNGPADDQKLGERRVEP